MTTTVETAKTDDAELLEIEEALWRANRAGDGSFYEQQLRPDALAVSPYGTATKDQTVAIISANRNPFLKTALSDQRVVRPTEDTAIVTYRVDITMLFDGKPIDRAALATSVYARENGRWLGVFHQQSNL